MQVEAPPHLTQHQAWSSPGEVFRRMALSPWKKTMMWWENLQMHSSVAHRMDPLSDLSLVSAKQMEGEEKEVMALYNLVFVQQGEATTEGEGKE